MQIPIFHPEFDSVSFGIFWLGRLLFWWDIKIYGNVLVASFCMPEIGICVLLLIASKLVLLLEFHEGGCCIACVCIIALPVQNDGMLAVCEQCGCVHPFNMCFDTYAF